jgi:hypothetical protein
MIALNTTTWPSLSRNSWRRKADRPYNGILPSSKRHMPGAIRVGRDSKRIATCDHGNADQIDGYLRDKWQQRPI